MSIVAFLWVPGSKKEKSKKKSLLAHTIFVHSQLPLNVWFLAIQLLTHRTNYMSTMELHRSLNVNVKTARMIRRKIIETLTGVEGKYVL